MLKNLKIYNGSISPEFDSSIYNYEVLVDDTAISLVMDFDLDKEDTITIHGNDYLESGENHVLVELFDGNVVKTYTLTVYKQLSNVIKNNDILEKIEINTPKYDNSFIRISIVVGTLVIILLLYKLIFKLHK